MKKLLGLVIAVCLMFGIAGQASAYWTDNDLLLTVYNEDDNEVTVDLGDLSTDISLTATNVTLASAGTVSLSQFNNLTWGDLSMALYARNQSGYLVYFGLTKDTSDSISNANRNTFAAGVTSIYTQYTNESSTNVNIQAALSGVNITYDYVINKKGASTGTYLAFNKENAYGEAILSELETVGYVDMYLYCYSIISPATQVTGETTDYVAVIRLNSDGSIVLNPETSTVPIPASLLLFGSGLLGLFGIRRKIA